MTRWECHGCSFPCTYHNILSPNQGAPATCPMGMPKEKVSWRLVCAPEEAARLLDGSKLIAELDTIYRQESESRQYNEDHHELCFAMFQNGICYATRGLRGLITMGTFDVTDEP